MRWFWTCTIGMPTDSRGSEYLSCDRYYTLLSRHNVTKCKQLCGIRASGYALYPSHEMENLVVAKLNVYCPKFVLSRHEELQRVFESTEYCVKLFPTCISSVWNKNYVLRFEQEDHRYTHPIQQEETEEQRNYNEARTNNATAISK